MINLREVEEAIKDLEQGSATYENCKKLAALYIVRDHLEGRAGGQYMTQYANNSNSNSNYGYYPYDGRGFYERGRNSYTSPSYAREYGYAPMGQYTEEDLMIKRGMPEREWR